MAENFGLSLINNESDKTPDKSQTSLDLNGITRPAAPETPHKRSLLNEAVHTVVGTVWHDEKSKVREEVEHYTTELAKTVPLFMLGSRNTYAASALLYGLDQVHRGDSLQNQVSDFGLGAVKGTVMKGTFDLIGKKDIGIAAKGLGLGVSSRLAEVGLTRQTYFDKNGEFDLTTGLMRTAETAFAPKMLAADVMIFGAAHGLFKAGNWATKGAIERSPLLSTIGMGGTFGFVSGTGAEMQRQADNHEQFDPVKAAVRGFLQAGVTGLASVPGGMQMARLQRESLNPSDPAGSTDAAGNPSGGFGTRLRTTLGDFKDTLTGSKVGLTAGSDKPLSGANMDSLLGGKIVEPPPSILKATELPAEVVGKTVGEPVGSSAFKIGDPVRVGSRQYELVGVDPKSGDVVIHTPVERRAGETAGWEPIATLEGAQKLDVRPGVEYATKEAQPDVKTNYETDFTGIYRHGDGVFGIKPNPDGNGFLVRHLPEFQVLPAEGVKPPLEVKPLTLAEGEVAPGAKVQVGESTGEFIGLEPGTGDAVVRMNRGGTKLPDVKVENLDGYGELPGMEGRTLYKDASGRVFFAERVPGEGFKLSHLPGVEVVKAAELRPAQETVAESLEATESVPPVDKATETVQPADRAATATDTTGDRQLGKATWKNADNDVPVEVTAYLGKDPAGVEYVRVKNLVTGVESETGIPLKDIVFDKPAEAPKSKTVEIDVAPEKEAAFKEGARLLIEASSKHATVENVSEFVAYSRTAEGQTVAAELAQFAEASGRQRAVDLVRDSFAHATEITISVPEGMHEQFSRGAELMLKLNQGNITPQDIAAFRQYAQGEGRPLVAEMFELAQQLKNPALETLVREAFEMPREVSLYVPPELQPTFQKGATLLQRTLEPGAGPLELQTFREFAKTEGASAEPYFMELARQMGGDKLLFQVREAYHGKESAVPVEGTEQYVFVAPEKEDGLRKGVEVAKMFLEQGKDVPWYFDALKYYAKGEGAELEVAMKEYAAKSENPQLQALVNEAYLPMENVVAPGKPQSVQLDLRAKSETPTQAELQKLVTEWRELQSLFGTLPEPNAPAIREWRQSVIETLEKYPDIHEAAKSYGSQTSDSQIASVLDFYFGTKNLETFPGVKPVDPFAELSRSESGLDRSVSTADLEAGYKAPRRGEQTVEQLIAGLDHPSEAVKISSAIFLKGQEMTPEQMKRYLEFLFTEDPTNGGIYLDKMHMPNSYILHYLRGAVDAPQNAPASLEALSKILTLPAQKPAEFPKLIEQYVRQHGELQPWLVNKLREEFTTGGVDGVPREYSPLVPQIVRDAMDVVPERPPREDKFGKGRFNKEPEAPRPEQMADRFQALARTLDAELPKDISNKLLELGQTDGRALSEVMLYMARSNRPQEIPNYAPEYRELLSLIVPEAKDIGTLKLLVDGLRRNDGQFALSIAGEMRPGDPQKWLRIQQLISGFAEGQYRMSIMPPKGKGPRDGKPAAPQPEPKWRKVYERTETAAEEPTVAEVLEPSTGAKVETGTGELNTGRVREDVTRVNPNEEVNRGQTEGLNRGGATSELVVLPARDGVELTVNAKGEPVSARLEDGTQAQFKWTENGLTVEYAIDGQTTGRISTSRYEHLDNNPDVTWLVEQPGQMPRQWVGNVELGTTESTFAWWKGIGEPLESPWMAAEPARVEPIRVETAGEVIEPPARTEPLQQASTLEKGSTGDGAPAKVRDVVLNADEAKIVQAIRDGNKRKPDIASAIGMHENIVKYLLQTLRGRGVLKDNGGGKYSVIE